MSELSEKEGEWHALAHLVVSCVDDDFVKDLVETGREGDIAVCHSIRGGIIYPHGLCLRFNGAYVRIRTLEDVLHLR